MKDNPAVIAAAQSGEIDNLRALLAADPSAASARDASGVSAILHALYRRQTGALDLLLAAQPELDIFESSSTGKLDRITELLQQDPGLAQAWSADGFTALHLASFFAQLNAAKLLLQYGAEVGASSRNAMQVTPLHSAAATHSAAIVQLLLEHGASPNARQQLGWTALHAAAQSGDRTMAEALLKFGADKSLATDDGLTPAALAAKSEHAEMAGWLR